MPATIIESFDFPITGLLYHDSSTKYLLSTNCDTNEHTVVCSSPFIPRHLSQTRIGLDTLGIQRFFSGINAEDGIKEVLIFLYGLISRHVDMMQNSRVFREDFQSIYLGIIGLAVSKDTRGGKGVSDFWSNRFDPGKAKMTIDIEYLWIYKQSLVAEVIDNVDIKVSVKGKA